MDDAHLYRAALAPAKISPFQMAERALLGQKWTPAEAEDLKRLVDFGKVAATGARPANEVIEVRDVARQTG